jgi:DNA-binding MarR family transcriptional regulator
MDLEGGVAEDSKAKDRLRQAKLGALPATVPRTGRRSQFQSGSGLDKTGLYVYMHEMENDLDLGSMQNCVCFKLRRATRAVTRFFDAELRRRGIRPTQTPVLAALAARSGWSMEELSEWLGLDRTSLLRNLRPLERDGLVKTTNSGRGGRVSLAITSRGRTNLASAMPDWRSAQDAVVKTLGEERWTAILSDLDRASLALEQ